MNKLQTYFIYPPKSSQQEPSYRLARAGGKGQVLNEDNYSSPFFKQTVDLTKSPEWESWYSFGCDGRRQTEIQPYEY